MSKQQPKQTLPQEIIVNILSRLPPKSIGRFRCVSKPWSFLLSQPHFIKSHLKNTQHNLSLLLLPKHSTTLYTINLTNQIIPCFATHLNLDGHHFSSTKVNIDTMASCDGLILLKNQENKLLLLNPITKQFQVLPDSPFALDHNVSHSLEGFGYDCRSEDYKVITLSYYDAYYYEDYDDNDPNCNGIYIDVYSVRNGTWKRRGTSPYDHAVGWPTSGVYSNGRLHWLACKTVHRSVLVGFDLGEEKFYELPPPGCVDVEKFVFMRLVEFGGCIAMFDYSLQSGGTDVWVMKEYGVGESWTNFTVSDDEKSEFRPVCLFRDEDEMVLLKDADDDFFVKKVVTYNMKEATFRDVEVDGVSDEFCVGGAFVESLVSPFISDRQHE